MKRIIIISILISFTATLSASWMGETWLWVKVKKTYPHKFSSGNRKVTLHVLKWALGAGHGDSYGKNFPGKIFTVTVICKNPTVAKNLKTGETFWVKHHASNGFYWDNETRRSRTWSNSSWKHLGHSLWVRKPTITKSLITGKSLPNSPNFNLLWAVRHSNNVTLKFRYSTKGKWVANFHLFNIKETKKSVTLAVTYAVSSKSHWHTNLRKKDNKTIQFNAATFAGKKINILVNGKLAAVLK